MTDQTIPLSNSDTPPIKTEELAPVANPAVGEEAMYKASLEGQSVGDPNFYLSQGEGEKQKEGTPPEPRVDPAADAEPFADEETDPLVSDHLNPFSPVPADQEQPMDRQQVAATAELINGLPIGQAQPVSVGEIERVFNENMTGETLDAAIKGLMALEGPKRRSKALSILNRTDLAPEDRVKLVTALEADAGTPDLYAVQRSNLETKAQQDIAGLHGVDDQTYFVNTMRAISDMPKLPRAINSVAPEAEVTEEELRAALGEHIALTVEEANKQAGVGNFLPTLLPFYNTVPVYRVLKRINDVLPKDQQISQAEGAFLPGTALRQMRDAVEVMSTDQKARFYGEVLKVLKPNGSLLHHENAHVTSYILQQLFYKDLTGQDAIPMADEKTQKAFIRATTQSEYWKRQADHETDPKLKKAYADQAERYFVEAQNIDANKNGRLYQDAADTSLDQWLGDLAILDFMGIESLAKGTIKLGKKGAMTAVRGMAKAAPGTLGRAAVDALNDPNVREALFRKMGPADVAETFLPTAMKDAAESGINGMGEVIARAQQMQEELIRARAEGLNVTSKMKHDFATTVQQIAGTYGKGVAELHLDKSVFNPGELGVESVARYGRTTHKPFANLAKAREALSKMPFSDGKVVQLDEATGKFVEVADDVKSGKGQYFIERAEERGYNSDPSEWNKAALDLNTVRDPWYLGSQQAPLARLWNWINPSTSSRFGADVADEVVTTAMKTPVLQRLQGNIVSTLKTLSGDEQRAVAALLKMGEEKGVDAFRAADIKAMFPKITDRTIASYYEMRTLAETMFTHANGQQRAEWFRAGVKEVTGPSGRVGFGKAVSADEAVRDIRPGYDVLHVYDPETNVFRAMTRSEIDDLYKNGQQVARMEDLIQSPKFEEATHVILGQKTGLKELPRVVMDKVKGYYPHIFEGNYVVYGVSKAGNRVAMAVARTVGDADAKIAELKSSFASSGNSHFVDFDKSFDRSLRDPLIADKSVSDPIFNATQKVYGARSGNLLENASVNHGSHMVDPVEALLRGMELVSHSLTKGELVKNMENRLHNTVKLLEKQTGKVLTKDPRAMVRSEADLTDAAKMLGKDYRRLLAYMKQIDMVRAIPDAAERHMAIALEWAASTMDTISKKVLGYTPKAIDNLGGRLVDKASRGFDPTALMTGFNHRTLIASNPLQQRALQMTQVLMMAGVAPLELPKAIARTAPIENMLMTRTMLHSPDTWKWSKAVAQRFYDRQRTVVSKLTGIPEAELEKLVGVLDRSGLIDSVGMHTQMRNDVRSAAMDRMLDSASVANRNTIGRTLGKGLSAADSAIFGTMSKHGFEAGESFNRIATFLTLYQRDAAKGLANLSDPAYIRKITGESQELVGSMMRETSAGYQRGWLKAAFQFVAFQHKMAALMLTSRHLTLAQKVKLSLAQFALFGTKGAAHFDAARRSMETLMTNYEAETPDQKHEVLDWWYSPETQEWFDGMIFDHGINTLLRTVGGDDTPEFAFNHRFAPGGGSEFIADAVLEMVHNPTERVFGLGTKKASKVVEFFDHMRKLALYNSSEFDGIDPHERMLMLAKEGGSLAFSGYDKYLAASAARQLGGWISDTGNITEGSSSGLEYSLYAMLGVNTKDRQQYYDVTEHVYGSVRHDPKGHDGALKNIADQMFQRMVNESTKFNGQPYDRDVFLEMERREARTRGMLLSYLEPSEQERVSEMIRSQIQELLRDSANRSTTQEAFVQNITRDLRDSGMLNEDALKLDVYLKRQGFFDKHPQLRSDFEHQVKQMTQYEDQ